MSKPQPTEQNEQRHHLALAAAAALQRLRDGRRRRTCWPALPSARRLHGDHLVIKASPYHNRRRPAIFGRRARPALIINILSDPQARRWRRRQRRRRWWTLNGVGVQAMLA